MASEFDDDKNFVLVENTAQTVFKYLDHLKDSRPNLGTRWIWELLQNARDVAPPHGVAVSIDASESRLVLKHTGRPFRNREIAHLIYHGSTKAKEEGDLGRFGSGFLSTHLLSSVVRVKGVLHDGRWFNFQIDRSGRTVEELRESMDRSWSDFKQSVAASANGDSAFTTEFEYNFKEDAKELIQAGLDQLKLCGPLVLAFGQELTDISVATTKGTWGMARKGSEPLKKTSVLSIECREGDAKTSRYVALKVNEKGGVVAVLLEGPENQKRLALGDNVPRLYIVFPLISTERIVLPVAIHEFQFKPREDRDGIILDGDTDGGKENRPLLENFAASSDELLQCVAEERWEGTAQLLRFDPDSLPEWAQQEWFLVFLRARLTYARQAALLATQDNTWIAPKDSWIPHADSETLAQTLGELLAIWEGAAQKLAPIETIQEWSKNLANWGRLLKLDPASLEEAFTIERLAELIASTATVASLSQRLPRSQDPSVGWLPFFNWFIEAGDSSYSRTWHSCLARVSGSESALNFGAIQISMRV